VGAVSAPFTASRAQALRDGGLVALVREGSRIGAVDLAVGTPQAPQPPDELLAAAADAMRAGHNQYEDPSGIRGLRTLIAGTLTTPADPDTEITITVGATEGLCVAVLTAVDPGDEVIVLEPFFENFLGPVAIANGQPRFVRLRPPHWRLDPDELASAFGPRTRAIILNTPHNPTGRVFDLQELEHIAYLCDRWNTTVICDEVYAAYTFGGRRHISPADLPDLRQRSISIGSFSKSHAISGWRLGFLRATPERTSALRRVHVATTSGASAPLQHAMLAANLFGTDRWNPAPSMEDMAGKALDLVRQAGMRAEAPEGGCYVMADIRPVTGDDSASFATRLLEKAGVLVAPGTFFYADPADGAAHIRVAFNRTPETLADAASRLAGLRLAGLGRSV
jgi:N-succinyldiaminopimelate aminotransferase